jgi:hypothetical protein
VNYASPLLGPMALSVQARRLGYKKGLPYPFSCALLPRIATAAQVTVLGVISTKRGYCRHEDG